MSSEAVLVFVVYYRSGEEASPRLELLQETSTIEDLGGGRSVVRVCMSGQVYRYL